MSLCNPDAIFQGSRGLDHGIEFHMHVAHTRYMRILQSRPTSQNHSESRSRRCCIMVAKREGKLIYTPRTVPRHATMAPLNTHVSKDVPRVSTGLMQHTVVRSETCESSESGNHSRPAPRRWSVSGKTSESVTVHLQPTQAYKPVTVSWTPSRNPTPITLEGGVPVGGPRGRVSSD